MAEENNPEEDDVEAEMLRMMQEEIGDADESADDAGIAETATEADEAGADTGEGENLDDMLEQEMLKAMQSDPGGDTGDAAGALSAFAPPMGAGDMPDNIARLSDVDVNVTVELGGTTIAIKDIMGWTRDSIVELEPEESEPVDVLVNGKLFAKGEVVVVGDTFGVRIIELVDQPDEPSFDNY